MEHLSFSLKRQFVTYSGLARRTIEMTSKPLVPLVNGIAHGPPPASLPTDIRKLLASILCISIPVVDFLWSELQEEVWRTPAGETSATDAEIAQYTKHGSSFSIGSSSIISLGPIATRRN